MESRWYPAIVADNLDPLHRARLRLTIPAITGSEVPHPEWIEARLPGLGPGAAALLWVPPVEAVVVVELDAGDVLRWRGAPPGSTQELPADLVDNYPRRAGLSDPAGAHVLALDSDDGLLVFVRPQAGADQVSTLELHPEGRLTVTTAAGDVLELDGTRARVTHAGGMRVSRTLPGVFAAVVLEGLLVDLLPALTEVSAFMAAWGVPVTNLGTLLGKLPTFYRSSSLETD